MGVDDPIEAVARYYDELGEGERDRLVASARGRVSLEIHRRFLRRFIQPGWRVLEIGAGPGRFTIDLAELGTRIVVTDLSPVQLELNARHVSATAWESRVERRELVDVRDTSRYADGEFDAVVAFGGPLSYAFERIDEAMQGLFRIVGPGGPVIASVMSLLGSWRFFLPQVTAEAEIVGEDAMDAMIDTGDVRHIATGGDAHICQMFRWRDVEEFVRRNGGAILDGSASNFASLSDVATMARLEESPDRWRRFIDHEVATCSEPGARDGGTHILFAASTS